MMGIVARIGSIMARRLTRRPHFATNDVVVGRNVTFGSNVVFNCKRVRIGDGVLFYDNVTIDADTFEIGDYGTIYSYCFFPGPGEVRIGHNFWLGQNSIVDGQAGTRIGNNVGIGAHSQLWTHMIFGDVMAGSRFHGSKPLVVEDDAWLVGHCLVSPVRIGARSVVLLGSVVTGDVPEERVYAGVPAKDITDKMGAPWAETPPEQRAEWIRRRLDAFAVSRGITDVKKIACVLTSTNQRAKHDPSVTVFDVARRRYVKRGTEVEYDLIRFLLPEAKFLPEDESGAGD